MLGEERDDWLFVLVLAEGFVSLVCAYDLILLALYGVLQQRWVPHVTVFLAASVAMVLTSALADYRRRRVSR